MSTIYGLPIDDADKNTMGRLHLPELIFGAAAFSQQYNSVDHLNSTVPLRTVRLALR